MNTYITTFPNKKKYPSVRNSVSLVLFTPASPGGCDVSHFMEMKVLREIEKARRRSIDRNDDRDRLMASFQGEVPPDEARLLQKVLHRKSLPPSKLVCARDFAEYPLTLSFRDMDKEIV